MSAGIFLPAATLTSGSLTPAAVRGSARRTYRPTALLRLFVRLEDFTNDDGPDAVSEAEPAPSRASALAAGAQLQRRTNAVSRLSGDFDPAAEAGARAAARAARTPPSGVDAAPPNDAPRDLFAIEVSVVPLDLQVELNSFRIADKLTASFSLRDLPIVPDIVRSILVEAYMGTVRVEDFGDPARWIPRLLNTEAPMFRGYADEFEAEMGDDFRIQISARSLEARLMDAKIHPLTKERRIQRNDSFRDQDGAVVRGEKITSYVRRLLSTVPEFSGALGGDRMGVKIFPNFDPAREPVLSATLFLRSLQTAASRAAAAGQVQAAPAAPQGVDPAAQAGAGTPMMPAPTPGEFSVWDVITRAAELCGLLPIYDPSVLVTDASGALVRGADTLLLVPPQTVKETPRDGITIPGGPTDGFSREFSVGGVGSIRSEVRFMVWGHNISKMTPSRKFGRIKAPAVRVVCHDPDGAAGSRVLVAKFPATRRGTAVAASGSGRGRHPPVEEVVTKVVRGIRDQRQLEQIAVAAYHSLSRHEATVKIETSEMASYIDPTRPETHNENPDLLRLRPGTPVRVMVARRVLDPANGDVGVDQLSELFERRANPAFLRKALLDGSAGASLTAADRGRIEEALGRIEQAYQSSRLTDWFYVRCVNHRFSATDGYSVEMELANFVEARSLPADLSPGDARTNDAAKKIKPGQSQVDPRRAAARVRFDDLASRGTGR